MDAMALGDGVDGVSGRLEISRGGLIFEEGLEYLSSLLLGGTLRKVHAFRFEAVSNLSYVCRAHPNSAASFLQKCIK